MYKIDCIARGIINQRQYFIYCTFATYKPYTIEYLRKKVELSEYHNKKKYQMIPFLLKMNL